MKVRLVLNGILHMVQVRKDSNKQRAVARVHNVQGEPVSVLTEVGHNKFIDTVENKLYCLNPMTRVMMGV